MVTLIEDDDCYRPDGYKQRIRFFMPDGVTPKNMTGSTFQAHLRVEGADRDDQWTLDLTQLAAGILPMTIPSGIAVDINDPSSIWDLKVLTGAYDNRTLFRGRINYVDEVPA